jgi:hypothetical protein
VVQTPTLVITKPRPFICRNETTTLTVSGASSYIWSTGAVSSSIAISPLQNTTYTVSGIDSGCVVTKTIVQMVSNCTGIEETNSGKLSLKAYPNPFNEELIIEAVNNEKVTVTIMDALGKNIHQDVMTGGSSHSINTSGLNAGIYIISISNTHETVSKKFIKH